MTTTKTTTEIPVSWRLDDIDIDATLTLPDGDGPFPAVIMVAGSGPTDRNWNSPLIPGANGSAALLAHALTELGYVTLRYDKRASGTFHLLLGGGVTDYRCGNWRGFVICTPNRWQRFENL
jgi:fermentation-respiration switch protein FrsA (DUF1100 family)